MNLSSCHESKVFQSINRMVAIDTLNQRFFANKWLELNDLSTKKIKDIMCQLMLESNLKKNWVVTDKWSIYGSNFPTLSEFTIDALSACKKTHQSDQQQTTFLDIGCGWGAVTWKALLAGCKVHAIDIGFGENSFIEGFNDSIKNIVPKDIYQNNLVIVHSSIYDLPLKYPEYYQKFDIVHSSKVLHFQTPKNFNTFARIIYDLTKPLGNAYIQADSIEIINQSEDCKEIYQNNKKNNDIAPGYIYGSLEPDTNCYEGSREEIMKMDTLPINEDNTSAIIATFDTDSLETIFTTAGFKTKEKYYLYGEDNSFMYLKNTNHGGIGVAIELEKPVELVLESNGLFNIHHVKSWASLTENENEF